MPCYYQTEWKSFSWGMVKLEHRKNAMWKPCYKTKTFSEQKSVTPLPRKELKYLPLVLPALPLSLLGYGEQQSTSGKL